MEPANQDVDVKQQVLKRCQEVFPSWRGLTVDDFEMADPKGFSSFTMAIQAKRGTGVDPPGILYRQLAGKDNAILDFEAEKQVFLTLGDAGIAARCLHYSDDCRMEELYLGRTLRAEEVFDEGILRQVGERLARFHKLRPACLPEGTFFELLAEKWSPLARSVVVDRRDVFPENEQEMCAELEEIFDPETRAKVLRCVPEGEPVFCHNDTYHGNTMLLETGEVKLLDFEFSCLNHRAFDFANLFAETKMEHQQPDYPFFRIGAPAYTDELIAVLIASYLEHFEHGSDAARQRRLDRLVSDTRDAIMLSDYMYAMAALPLAVEPIQKIRFIPYSLLRFKAFLAAYEQRFPRA